MGIELETDLMDIAINLRVLTEVLQELCDTVKQINQQFMELWEDHVGGHEKAETRKEVSGHPHR